MLQSTKGEMKELSWGHLLRKKYWKKMWGSKSRKGHAMGISRAKVEMKDKGKRKQTVGRMNKK